MSSDRCVPAASRSLSLPSRIAAAGGVEAWNRKHADLAGLDALLKCMCTAATPEAAVRQVRALTSLGQTLNAYAYMRALYRKSADLYYATILSAPEELLPVVYTPTVGEACQKFGLLPAERRGCYVSLEHRGAIKQVLQGYAAAELEKGPDGNYICDCIVFSDGGRILGLGDLGTWGMGIPIGKLDLYTVCGGLNPRRMIPVIIDAGCLGPAGNTGKLSIRDHPLYTGLVQDRCREESAAGTLVNSAYFGEDSMINEFMQAASDLFGKRCLLQFEDFNSNDAFPLLSEYRNKFLTYNDDIQGTASIAVAALMGALRLRDPQQTDLVGALRKQTFLFHGAGSANLGAASLLVKEAGVPKSQIILTNSRGVIWQTRDGSSGSYRNAEQKEFAQQGKPIYDSTDLVSIIEHTKPTCVIGAVGVAPGCFDKRFIDALVTVNAPLRPVVFALSNPKTQAEVTAEDAYTWSNGTVIFGSGTKFDAVCLNGKTHAPGQVNNVYIFPGLSFGAVCCEAASIPERLFMVAAQAVADSLDAEDMRLNRVVPSQARLREIGLNVAVSVVLESQRLGLASKSFGEDPAEVKRLLADMMWSPQVARS